MEFNLKEMQKKGSASITSSSNKLVGALIIVVLATALAPEMFSNLSTMAGDANIPGWVSAVMVVMVGAGLVFLIWKVLQ